MKTFKSDISGRRFPADERIPGYAIRSSVMKLIQSEKPDFDVNKFIALRELNFYREKYIAQYLEREVSNIGELDKKVVKTISSKAARHEQGDLKETARTMGDKIADKVASFGGSWPFIIIFICFIIVWIALNSIWLAEKDVDPYPFILLNLLLSCLAALQAPIIMMSQNRQAEKDRANARNDYMINLKSELEVRGLHEKLDHLMLSQQHELIEIQKIQIEMLNDIQKHLENTRQIVFNEEHITSL